MPSKSLLKTILDEKVKAKEAGQKPAWTKKASEGLNTRASGFVLVEEEIRQGTEGGENTHAVRRAATGRNTNKEHQESTRKARTARETPVVSGTEAACVYMCAYSVFSAGKKKKK